MPHDPDETGAPAPTAPADPDATAPPTPVSVPAERFAMPPELNARFEMLAVLGRGGMGIVYRARDRELGREVAIKRMLTDRARHFELFREEARVLAGLEHQNVVRLYEYGLAGDAPYLVMELVRGRSLAERLQAGRPTLVEAVKLALDVLAGLGAAHAAKIAHLDLKPANVFLDESGRARVADFGLARRAGEGPATVAGTPKYMAPEQWAGRPQLASDVFAFGLMFHEILTGQRLLGGTLDELPAAAARAHAAAPPSHARPSVPPALDAVVARALEPEPDRRPTVESLAASLTAWLSQLPGARHLTGELPPEPYKRLAHFRAADAAIFFGREDETAELVALVESPAVRLVLVSGPCGIGKSSLIAAGLGRALDLERYELAGVISGPDPEAAVLSWIAARSGLTTTELALDPRRAIDVALEIARKLRKTIVIHIDQGEELFTQNAPGAPAIARFFGLVERLVEAQGLPIKIVLSHRSEFAGELAPLAHRLSRHLAEFPVAEIRRAGLVAAIEGPSRLEGYGFRFESGLPERLADDILASQGQSALPVAQIICHQLHERMREQGGHIVTGALYEKALGGATGALQRYVESAVVASPEYGPDGRLARQLLEALTVREEGRERYARALDEDELLATADRERARAALERLIADHLVVREAAGAGRRVRLASEVICPLVDTWTLAHTDADRAARLLARAARQFDEQGDLLAGATLALVERELPGLKAVSAAERALVESSIRARRRKRLTAAVAAAALCAVAWFGFLRPGTLAVDSTPRGAQVLAAGRVIGSTPLELSRWPGEYPVAVRLEGHRDATAALRVHPGDRTAHRVELLPALRTVEVITEPAGASCELRGAAVTRGISPLAVPLPDGDYTLSVTLPGWVPRRTAFRVEAGAAPLLQRVTLESDSGDLRVTCPHRGSTLTLRDAARREVFRAALPMVEPARIPAGRYRAECTGDGNVSDAFDAVVTRGVTRTYLALTPPVAELSSTPWPADREHVERAYEPTDNDAVTRPDLQVTVPAGREGDEPGVTGKGWTYGVRAMRPRIAAANLDGKPGDEVVVSMAENALAALDPASGRLLWRATTFAPVHTPPQFHDVDGDGSLDVLVASWATGGDNSRGGFQVFSGPTGVPLLSYPRELGFSALTRIADEDADGCADFTLEGYDRHTHVLSGAVRRTLWLAPLDAAPERVIVRGADLVVARRDRPPLALASLDGTPRTTTTTPAPEPFEAPDEDRLPPGGHVTQVDLDADGTPDRLRIDGYAVFAPRWSIPSPPVAPGGLNLAGAADLDGDRAPDLVLASFWLPRAVGEGDLKVVSGPTGKTLWEAHIPGAVRRAATFRDLDGDNLPDLLLRSSDQQRGPTRVLAFSGRTGRRLAAWIAGAGQLAPLVIDHGGRPALLLDRSDPDDPERSALELVRLR